MKKISWDVLPLENSDLIAVKELQPPEFSDIIPAVKYYLASSFCHPIKITTDSRIVGIGTTFMHKDTAWLAHIIVHPEYRNMGIGGFITRYLVESVDANVFKTIFLVATALGEPVYKKLGFEAETEYLFFKEGKTDDELTQENIQRFDVKYATSIFNLDQLSTGEYRQVRLKEDIHHAWIYVEGQHMTGYYFPTLGDGLIVAENPVAGTALMNFKHRTNKVSILPADNKAGVDFLIGHDFRQFRTARRMRLGIKRNWIPQHIYNRVSGQIG